MATVKTCSRCKGKGTGNWRPVHAGIPGGCYKCDLSGKTIHFTMEERVELYIGRLEASLKELERRAAEERAANEAQDERSRERATAKGRTYEVSETRTRIRERSLNLLRDRWKNSSRILAEVKTTRKVTSDQQPTYRPYHG